MRTLVHDYSKTDILTRVVQIQSCKINAQKCYTVYKDHTSYIQIKWKKKYGWQYSPFQVATVTGKTYCL